MTKSTKLWIIIAAGAVAVALLLALRVSLSREPEMPSRGVGALGVGPMAVTCTTYNSADTPKSIPDNSYPAGATSDIVVSGFGTYSEITVTVTISHANIADVWVELEDAGAAGRSLFYNGDASAGSYAFSNVAFNNDNGTVDIYSASPPYSDNTYLPAQALRTNRDGDGTWTLYVWDRASGNTGTLESWSVTLCYDAEAPTPTPTSTPTVTPTPTYVPVASCGSWFDFYVSGNEMCGNPTAWAEEIGNAVGSGNDTIGGLFDENSGDNDGRFGSFHYCDQPGDDIIVGPWLFEVYAVANNRKSSVSIDTEISARRLVSDFEFSESIAVAGDCFNREILNTTVILSDYPQVNWAFGRRSTFLCGEGYDHDVAFQARVIACGWQAETYGTVTPLATFTPAPLPTDAVTTTPTGTPTPTLSPADLTATAIATLWTPTPTPTVTGTPPTATPTPTVTGTPPTATPTPTVTGTPPTATPNATLTHQAPGAWISEILSSQGSSATPRPTRTPTPTATSAP